MTSPTPLLPGDVLLYSKSDFFGLLTAWKTWSPAVHVELYEGEGMSLASRNGMGVNRYLYRSKQLAAVLRPNAPLSMKSVTKWFETPYKSGEGVRGRYYGWLDLLRFYSIRIPTGGWICSEFVAKALKEGGLKAFAEKYDEGTVDPGDYFVSPAFDWVWVRPNVLKQL